MDYSKKEIIITKTYLGYIYETNYIRTLKSGKLGIITHKEGYSANGKINFYSVSVHTENNKGFVKTAFGNDVTLKFN